MTPPAPAPASRSDASAHLAAVLERLAGPGAAPRPDQIDAVEALLEPAARVLVVQATGWGKSAVYWAAARALRTCGKGPALVVSPLLALMRDQVDAANRAGLAAATVNSANIDEWDDVFARLAADRIDVLLVSPERLGNPRFAAQLDGLLAAGGLVVIDEAHCISDWGFDFRPDYQRLARALLAAPNAAVLATTATANERVTDDIAHQLGDGVVAFRGTLARTSLRLSVVPGLAPLDRYAWTAAALGGLPGSGIVYVLTVAEADRLAGFLASAGHEVAAYTGALDSERRVEIEERLKRNDLKAVVATSALGMGYDKPDLGFVIHVGSPATPVAYYQQIGRAGRAVSKADAVLLPSEADERIWAWFAESSIPDERDAAAVLDELAHGQRTLVEIEGLTGVRRGRLEALLKILAVEGAVAKNRSAWAATGLGYVHDRAKWAALREVRRREAEVMRAYAHGEGCLMAFLQHALDDPDPAPCGRCSVCTGELPAPGAAPPVELVAAALAHLRGGDLVVEARKQWPAGVSRRGRIVGAAEGRAVAYGDDPAWSAEIARLHADGAVPEALLDGAVEVLRRWSRTWPERPVAIVPAPAPDPTWALDTARRLAEIGRRPLLEVFDWSGAALPADTASAPLVRRLEDAVQLSRPELVPDEPVILVAGEMRTGWTITIAAALLREAGCPAVLPLVLHRRP
ncbi:MAG: RecQ family ATP-dependent DNA helicase [Acidimicrobiales bacterium]